MPEVIYEQQCQTCNGKEEYNQTTDTYECENCGVSYNI